jgi:TusA-related sulfurtransferase
MEVMAKTEKVLDVRGWSCPWCKKKKKSELNLMEPGQILEILVTDPMTLEDFPNVLDQSGHRLVKINEQPEFFQLYVRRGDAEKLGRSAGFQTGVADNRTREEETMTSTDLSSIQAASVVDARGSACPGPLLEAKKGIGKVKVGEILEILSNDAATKSDIPIWANKVGHEPLGHVEADGYDRIFVRRQK